MKKVFRDLPRCLGLSLGRKAEPSKRGLGMHARWISNQRQGIEIANLSEAEFQVYSQWGEDGIIDWLISNLPDIKKSFVEFGVEDYQESNTRHLLIGRNWRGMVLDGSKNNVKYICSQDIYWRHDLIAKHAFINKDNINKLIADSGLKGDIGLLSVDIDGNDYWVWQAIEVVTPAIVVCEYNAVLGDEFALSIPYEATFQRTRAHYSNLYFGASIRALVLLGESKGYKFVGTNSSGCNAFFVRQDYAPTIRGRLREILAYPSSFRESRDRNGKLTFVRGESRQALISHLPFTDPVSGRTAELASWGKLSSDKWLEGGPVRI